MLSFAKCRWSKFLISGDYDLTIFAQLLNPNTFNTKKLLSIKIMPLFWEICALIFKMDPGEITLRSESINLSKYNNNNK